jgi:hypothetical protein
MTSQQNAQAITLQTIPNSQKTVIAINNKQLSQVWNTDIQFKIYANFL